MAEKKRNFLNSLIIYLISFFLLFLVINHFLFKVTEYIENAFPSIAPNAKVVVNLLTYRLHAKERWDLAYLENKNNSEEYLVRRILGLPNETIYLKNGDVYIDDILQQKNSEHQKTLWVPCFNLAQKNKEKKTLQEIFTSFEPTAWALNTDGSLTTKPEAQGNFHLSAEKIGDKTTQDFNVSFDLTYQENQGQIFIMIPYYDKQYLLNLPCISTQKSPHIQEEMKILQSFTDIQLQPGIRYHIDFSVYDRKVEVYIDNRRVFRQSFNKTPLVEKRLTATSVLFGTINANATIQNLEVRKDIAFAATGRFGCDPELPYKLEHDQYFVATESQETSASDSRSFGAVKADMIKGKVVVSLYPNFFKWIY